MPFPPLGQGLSFASNDPINAANDEPRLDQGKTTTLIRAAAAVAALSNRSPPGKEPRPENERGSHTLKPSSLSFLCLDHYFFFFSSISPYLRWRDQDKIWARFCLSRRRRADSSVRRDSHSVDDDPSQTRKWQHFRADEVIDRFVCYSPDHAGAFLNVKQRKHLAPLIYHPIYPCLYFNWENSDFSHTHFVTCSLPISYPPC